MELKLILKKNRFEILKLIAKIVTGGCQLWWGNTWLRDIPIFPVCQMYLYKGAYIIFVVGPMIPSAIVIFTPVWLFTYMFTSWWLQNQVVVIICGILLWDRMAVFSWHNFHQYFSVEKFHLVAQIPGGGVCVCCSKSQ